MSDDQSPLRAQLNRIAAHEARVHIGPLTHLMRTLGRTAGFSALYRRIGPVIDPRIARIRDGRLMASLYGFPVLILGSTGARTGQPRSSALLYIRDGDDVVLIGTNFGQPRHPAWTANLIAQPEVVVDIGPERLLCRAELLDDDAWQALFPAFVAIYPGYANYLERRGGLTPRMFRLHPYL
ncbi:unannotated protein [freshwater metagenome]|uniref:Unannotated protein n=1 Tax=freshwater metagenome TaxID=449393 RepID=A0A6J7S5S0_9ZZZZ|nr:nitroreductase family deazaflavin-dependent oxidoreductase [Actinomycetota bacterium]MSW37639.1 nitroreductase family deazaflavin-dependent oxidoreductase [Actinomycetota bacterium]MSX39107.1 nitroreductase family deazaflavin-dependent oxidoreductase [Actinomycetota bacterium]